MSLNRMAHEAHVQMLRNMQLQQEQDLEDALRNAPALSSSTHGNGNGHGHGPEDEESPSVMSAPVGAATSSSSNQDKAKSFASITQVRYLRLLFFWRRRLKSNCSKNRCLGISLD